LKFHLIKSAKVPAA